MLAHILFAAAQAAAAAGYDLVPPHVATAANEYGNWTLSGTAVNLKHSIRLTSDLPRQRGSACLLLPTAFRDWSAEIALAAYGGRYGGDCYVISFTDAFCPDETYGFGGVALVINTSMADGRGESPVFVIDDDTGAEVLRGRGDGRVSLRSDRQRAVTLRLTRNGPQLTLEQSLDDGSFVRVMEKESAHIPERGYFSVVAMTGKKSTDVHDLVSFKLRALSADVGVPGGESTRIINANKELMDKSKVIRREMKEKRRSLMPKVAKMLEAMKSGNKEQVDFKEALEIVDELTERSFSSITIEELSQYISTYVREVALVSKGKISKSAQKIEDINEDITQLWAELKKELVNLKDEVAKQKDMLEKTLIESVSVNRLTNKNINLYSVKKDLKEQVSTNDSMLAIALMAICCVEFVAYVIFFCVKRRKTNNFKKAD